MPMKMFGTSLLVAVLVVILLGVAFGGIKVSINQPEETKTEYELFYMYGGPNGTYWLEPTAEYENTIYVDHASLEKWGIAPKQMGEKYIGTFDPTGWELQKIEKKEGK